MIVPTQFDFTQGNLQDYVDCPYRFYLNYTLRTKWPALVVDDAQEFELRGQAGARFHRVIQQCLLGVPPDRINQLVDEDPNPDLAAWWEGFLTHVPPWLVGEHWVETALTATLANRRLVAKYDLILADDRGGLTIFDWKTSQKSPRVEWLLERIQTRLYRMVLMQASPIFTGGPAVKAEQITMNYWFAFQPQSPVTLPYSQSTFMRDEDYLSSLIEEICTLEAGSYNRTSDLQRCRFCVYRSHCDRGIDAGDLADFEDFDLEPGDIETAIAFEDIPEIEF